MKDYNLFEILGHDAGGRLGKFKIGEFSIKTPNIAIVVNPNKLVVSPKEMKEFGVDLLITNSYIISKSKHLLDPACRFGLRKFLKWNGPVYTDSGTFQMYSQGIKDVDQKKIIQLQKSMQSDIVTPVDVFTLPDDAKEIAKKKLTETIKRISEARKLIKRPHLLNGPIQGGNFSDLRALAAREVAKQNPDVFSIGGIVPLMEQYRFRELVDIIITCKQNLPSNKPAHAFGAGHPMVFALLAAAGCDLFDSAMYSIAAQRGAYLTVRGTYKLKNISEFPCACKECASTNPDTVKSWPEEKQIQFLARHNLFATIQEIRTVRQAIREGSLWELVQERARAHPHLLEALIFMLKKHKKYFLELDPITKSSALMYSGEETLLRPEISRAMHRAKGMKGKKFNKHPFGNIPEELSTVYPFGQSVGLENTEVRPKQNQASVRKVVDYWFGNGASKLLGNFWLEVSRETGRIRRIHGNGRMLGTMRPNDGYFIIRIIA